MSARVVRVRLLVLRDREFENETPWVAGAMDEGTWEAMGVEESDAEFAAMRAKSDPDGRCESREITVTIDGDALVDLLRTPTVRADVVGAPESANEPGGRL